MAATSDEHLGAPHREARHGLKVTTTAGVAIMGMRSRSQDSPVSVRAFPADWSRFFGVAHWSIFVFTSDGA